ncbi:MAG: cobalamin-dependent protein, partial [Cyclobacteriaceae bacterium]|nr:cobalamin-dependent protein [Cyclobacteriaceae bacterium]
MNVLLVYPKYPDTYWSFSHALKFISKKAAYPPLGLITVSTLLPKSWNRKLVDLNIESLFEQDLLWADYVMISAMSVQSKSANEIIARCKKINKKIIAGGPLFTAEHENYSMVDHLILNEAEITLQPFLDDLNNGIPKKIYTSENFADMKETPIPDYSLLNISDYASLSIQYT